VAPLKSHYLTEHARQVLTIDTYAARRPCICETLTSLHYE